jgi:hypothetical protein
MTLPLPALPELPGKQATRLGPSQLRLYVARGTPNSTRAEQNLRTALDQMDGDGVILRFEVIDVSAHVNLAVSDGVIVTPTLIGRGGNEWHTIVGDLSDTPKLNEFLGTLRKP